MSCTHKFFGHPFHLGGADGLLPNWEVKTLIIGTFNPELDWHPLNTANYYYGRKKNYFWKVLPRFGCMSPVAYQDLEGQRNFLIKNKIGLTDLLISIDDADITEAEHVRRITTVLDSEIELFNQFTWNTDAIIKFILVNNVEAVYFTKLGNLALKNIDPNTFEAQMRIIEAACGDRIYTNRLHTPSANGLGSGSPRENVLINRWYNDNGGNKFPFLCHFFQLKNFPVTNSGMTDDELKAKYF